MGTTAGQSLLPQSRVEEWVWGEAQSVCDFLLILPYPLGPTSQVSQMAGAGRTCSGMRVGGICLPSRSGLGPGAPSSALLPP